MAQVSGKNGGYYGCLAAKRGSCENKTLVRRSLVEKIVLGAVTDQLADTDAIAYVLQRVESEIQNLSADLPEALKLKQAELTAEQRRLTNFLDFIGEGRGSQALGKALIETERRVDALTDEVDSLRRGRDQVFTVPPTNGSPIVSTISKASLRSAQRGQPCCFERYSVRSDSTRSGLTSGDRSIERQLRLTPWRSSKLRWIRPPRTAVRLHCESGPYRDRTGDLLRARSPRRRSAVGRRPQSSVFAGFTLRLAVGCGLDRGG